jgi:hypothetical protein
MLKILKKTAASALLACLPMISMAAPVVDQSNTSSSTYGFCYVGIGGLCGQSFVQTHDNIAGVGFEVSQNYSAGDGTVTVSVYSGYAGSPTGLIASGTSGTVNSNSGWVDIFWSPAALVTGDTYYLVIESTQPYLVAAFTAAASYANGNALYAGSASGWSGYDLAFRTYYDESANTVPEPLTLSLVGLGLVGVGISRRKAV